MVCRLYSLICTHLLVQAPKITWLCLVKDHSLGQITALTNEFSHLGVKYCCLVK